MLDAKAEIARVRSLYSADATQSKYNYLIYGRAGTRKTWTVGATAQRPVFIDSFDKGGTKHLTEFIKTGEVLVDSSWEATRVEGIWDKWATVLEDRVRSGFFAQFGTYCLDSFTNNVEALSLKIARKYNRGDSVLAIQDYQVLWNMIAKTIDLITQLPCDVVLTAHIQDMMDDMSGKKESTIAAPGQARIKLTQLFDEVYVAQATESSKGIDYTFLMRNNGVYIARTRMGGTILDTKEVQDLRAMRAKAGKAMKDLPLLSI